MTDERIAVIMCTWKRIHNRLERTLDLLGSQNDQGFDLFIWNNNALESELVDELVFAHAFDRTTVYHSNNNIGGIGRFYYARKLANQYKFVVFIDDDQDFDSQFIETFRREASNKSLSSWYSWRFTGDGYWSDRIRCTPNSADVPHYCGTGGMVIDSSIFTHSLVFKCPPQFSFIEDLWLSYCADMLGYTKHASSVNIQFCTDGLDQSESLQMRIAKHEMLIYLRSIGWNVI